VSSLAERMRAGLTPEQLERLDRPAPVRKPPARIPDPVPELEQAVEAEIENDPSTRQVTITDRQYQVRTQLGQEVRHLIQPHMRGVIETIIDQALGKDEALPHDRAGNLARSAGQVKVASQRLYVKLLEIANQDFDTREQSAKATMDQIISEVRGRPDEDLKALAEMEVPGA